MVSLHCVFWDEWLTCWKFKKAKCFLCLMAWDGLPSLWAEFLPPRASHPDSGEFVLPPWSWILFILQLHSTLWLIHNWPGLLTETKYHWSCWKTWPDLACQRHKIIVRHIFNPHWNLYYYACTRIIYGHWIDWAWGRSAAKAPALSHPPLKQYMSQLMSKRPAKPIVMQIIIFITHLHKTWTCN